MRRYTFDWRPSEHARVTSVLVREQFGSGVWRVLKWVVVGIVIVAALVTVATVALGDWRSAFLVGPLALVVGVMVAAFAPITGWLRAWQVRSLDPNVGHPITETLDDVGVHVALHTINVDFKWSGMHKVRETTEAFMFYYNRRSAYFLPKRCLDGPEAVNALRSWVRARLPVEVASEEV